MSPTQGLVAGQHLMLCLSPHIKKNTGDTAQASLVYTVRPRPTRATCLKNNKPQTTLYSMPVMAMAMLPF